MKNTLVKIKIIFIGILIFSCNYIGKESGLNANDIKYIQSMGLLDKNEKIYKFYSEFRTKNAGNFFTDKRIATYWIDERNTEKNEISYAFYADIKSIDTIYNAGVTYSPYLLVTKKDDTQFKVSVNGKREAIKAFFAEAIQQWEYHK